jgi:hypothetical protein
MPAPKNDCPSGSFERTEASDGTDATIPVSGSSAVGARADELVGTGAALGSGRDAMDGDARRSDVRWSWVMVEVWGYMRRESRL